MAPGDDAKVEFPPPVELEKWMMNTAKEKDRGAGMLRRMLKMNPAYGQQLAGDEEISEIVQVFAKRFKQVINGAEIPIKPATLYKPLCEVIWRVIGHVLSSFFELSDGGEVPVAKQAVGQVKMLLQTNLDLSNKLKELRRTYLIELTEHRDKQRVLSENVQRAIQSLQEQPVMFYEPLEYVLDETTKDFVRLVVEERLKLEMRAGFQADEANAEMSGYMNDLEAKLIKKEAELKQLRLTAAKNEQAMRKALEAQAKAEQDAKKANETAQQREEEFEQMAGKVSNMEWEVTQKKRQIAFLETDAAATQGKEKVAEQKALNEQMESQENQVKALQEMVMKLEMEKKKHKEEMASAGATAAAASAAAAESQAAAAAATAAANDAKTTQETLESAAAEKAKADKEKEVIHTETETEKVKIVEKVVEKIVHVTDTAAQEELVEKHMQVEKELRDALSALQMQLEEEQAHNKKLSESVASPEEEKKRKEKKSKAVEEEAKAEKKKSVKPPPPDDHDIEKAIGKVSAQFEKQVKGLQAEVDRLTAELEAARTEVETVHVEVEKKPKKIKVKKEVEPEDTSEKEDKAAVKWKRKFEELDDQHADLQDEYAKLESKVAGLLDKLREKMSDDEVQETLTRIRLSPPPPKKKRKKKAYERLYDDAQRRIVDMKVKKEKAEKIEMQVLAEAAKKVKDRRSLRAVESLFHLQKAASSTSERFHDAVARFQEQHPDDPAAQMAPGMGGAPGVAMNSTIPEEASPQWVAGMAQYHGHGMQPRQSMYRGRTNRSLSLQTPPGYVSPTSPGPETEGAMSMSQAYEMPGFNPQHSGPPGFNPQFAGPVSQVSPHHAMHASFSGSSGHGLSSSSGYSPEMMTSPTGSSTSVSPTVRRRYGSQPPMQSGSMVAGGSAQSKREFIQMSHRHGNPAMPRQSFANVQTSPSHSLGRQSVAQAADVEERRQSVAQAASRRAQTVDIEERRQSLAQAASRRLPLRVESAAEAGKAETWLPPRRAAELDGSMVLDAAVHPGMAGRRTVVARESAGSDRELGDTGGLRPSDELLLQLHATPPGLAPSLSPSPPGFSTRLGNESGPHPKVRTPLDPMSRSGGSLSPGLRRGATENFTETLQGQSLSNSWGGGFVRSATDLTGSFTRSTPDLTRSTPDLTALSSSFKAGMKQRKGGNVLGLAVLGQSP